MAVPASPPELPEKEELYCRREVGTKKKKEKKSGNSQSYSDEWGRVAEKEETLQHKSIYKK